MAVWISFNSMYSRIYPEVNGEWRQIEEFANWPNTQKLHARLLDVLPAYREAIDILSEEGVSDVRTSTVRRIGEASNLVDVLRCVYQVRCNLFHGGKHPDVERDRVLTAAGFVVIANLISMHNTGRALRLTLDPATWVDL